MYLSLSILDEKVIGQVLYYTIDHFQQCYINSFPTFPLNPTVMILVKIWTFPKIKLLYIDFHKYYYYIDGKHQ